MKKKIITSVGILLAVALVVGLTVVAVGTYGSEDDPLVTLSYLNDTVTPSIMEDLDSSLDAKSEELSGDFQKLASESTSGYESVTLKKGETLICSIGTELLLRSGTAVSAGSESPYLIDETGGVSMSATDISLTVNHMYMVTSAGGGAKVSSDEAVLLVRGAYTIN